MSGRPFHGRMRGHHSLAGEFSVAMLIAAVAIVIFALAGGFRP